MSKTPLFAITAVCLIAAASLFGYALEGETWPQNSEITMELSLGGNQNLIDGNTSFNASAEDALAQWNSYLGRFQFFVVRNSSVTPTDGDRRNSVFFSSTIYDDSFGADTLAVTLRTSQGTTLVETDVIFNSAQPFNSYRGPLRRTQSGDTLHDFHRIALHEFGHVLGLDHPDEANPSQNVAAIMNAFESDVDALQADDIDGGQYLYGAAPPVATNNLVNLSTRGAIGTGDDVLIGGFIVQGSQQSMVLRAIGPSLEGKGLTGAIDDPVLELHDASGNLLRSNDDWQEGPDEAALSSKGIAPTYSREAAMIARLDAGNYTAVVRGYNGSTGIGLVELYDLQATNARAANISTRGKVETGDRVMIAGFIVGGDTSKQVILRAIGPTLGGAVNGPLPDPALELHNSSGTLVAQNDDWREGSDAATIQNLGLAPGSDRESALLATLSPGSYTAVIQGFNDATGIGLAEVYDLSPSPNQ